jgi:hypothetical protein
VDDHEIDELARAVHDRIAAFPPGQDPARCFGVRVRADGGFALVPFWSGVARELPGRLTPPDGCWGIALDSGGWAAPLDDDPTLRPSQHPMRKRMYQTVIVYGSDATDVTVLEVEHEEPQVLRGAVGVVPELMRDVWSRRRASA